jgi:hypothetical protein
MSRARDVQMICVPDLARLVQSSIARDRQLDSPEGPRQSGSAVRDVAPATGHGPDDSLVSQVGDGAPDCGACYTEQVHEFLLRRHWLPDSKLS